MPRVSASTSHPSLPSRRFLAAIAVVCLVAQAFAMVHLMVVRHARCAAHDEVVHVSVDRAQPAHVTPTPDATSIQGADGDLAEVDDAHCTWLSELRTTRVGHPPVLTAAPATTVDELGLPRDLPLAGPRALYRLAPKISPPHAA